MYRFMLMLTGVALLAGVATAQEPRNGIYSFVLDHAVGEGKGLAVYVDCTEGKFGRGIALGVSPASHEVDASGLSGDDLKFAGTIKVKYYPDPSDPTLKPVNATYSVKGEIKKKGIAGSYTGMFGPAAVKGSVTGQLLLHPAVEVPLRLDLSLEEALAIATGKGSGNANRVHLSFVLREGAIENLQIKPSKGAKWTGTVGEFDLKSDGKTLAGKVHATINDVPHVFQLQGVICADAVGGAFQTVVGGKPGKSGRFTGTAMPAPQPKKK